MQLLSTVGFPRIGAQRELKKWVEGYFNEKISKDELLCNAAELRKRHWLLQKQNGISFIPSNDFSFYDTFLDMAFLLGIIPEEHSNLMLNELDTYFAMAKGYQKGTRDAKALPMKKWFNTNYHYMVPTIDEKTNFKLKGSKPFDEYLEALGIGIKTKPVIIGPVTFLKLSKTDLKNKTYFDYGEEILKVYCDIFERFNELNAEYIQVDEPILVTDIEKEEAELFYTLYKKILSRKKGLKVLLQTYFGDIRDIYEKAMELDFDALGLDFVEGTKNVELIEKFGFPKNKALFAGLVNGKNIWINNYKSSLEKMSILEKHVERDKIILNTSCSLLHVPYTISNEKQIGDKYKKHFAFAEEKLKELNDLSILLNTEYFTLSKSFMENTFAVKEKLGNREFLDESLREDIGSLIASDFIRQPVFEDRLKEQKEKLKLPVLPITTIGSFPQMLEVKSLRKKFKNGELAFEQYNEKIKEKIAEIIKLQEDIGLDVLVHGEFERNDMVEYFGENLSGFLFTQNGWVQSYGTRCVKPPIIFGDIKREKPITVDYIAYAQSLTDKPVKGMLTGPVTILNWSFPREDLSLRDIAYQLALAIKAEVRDLERRGIKIIQIDEAALREKLPLRKQDWHSEYLGWAINAFRLVHSSVKPHTQIHTHMCYSEFEDIIKEIDDMNADVITFEAARSDLDIIDVLVANNFRTEVGPGVYDIHSPRIPRKEELKEILKKIINKLPLEKIWVNPDCGLKTRGMDETVASLKNMVDAAKELRAGIL
ncbi:MAG: 5-methyltetrahydropteroyltriglutamate--homocysteine S-methyltransferase [Bacillota bacterium]